MGDRRSWTNRGRVMLGRLTQVPAAGRRRYAELVRRDDVAHHLLLDLHDRVNGLTEQLGRLETQLGAFATRQEDVAAAAGRAALALDPADRAAFAAENGAAAITEMRRELNGLTTDVAALAWREADVDVPDTTGQLLVSVVLPDLPARPGSPPWCAPSSPRPTPAGAPWWSTTGATTAPPRRSPPSWTTTGGITLPPGPAHRGERARRTGAWRPPWAS